MQARFAIVFAALWSSSGCAGVAKPADSPADRPPAGEPGAGGGALLALPGECVDPVVDGDKHDAARPFDKHVQADVRSEDLDGDGAVDAFVKPAWSCGDACKRSVYVMRGTCGHYVGTFASVDRYEALETKSHGLRDLSVRPRRVEEDGEMHCYHQVFKFDGALYKQARQRECECKDEGAKCTAWNE